MYEARFFNKRRKPRMAVSINFPLIFNEDLESSGVVLVKGVIEGEEIVKINEYDEVRLKTISINDVKPAKVII